MNDHTLSYDAATRALEELDLREFEVDLVDSGTATVDAPTTFVCCTVSVISISLTATAWNGCVVAG